jgi:hypothetical protein
VSLIAFDVLVLLISITSGLRAVPRNTIGSKYRRVFSVLSPRHTKCLKAIHKADTYTKYVLLHPSYHKTFGIKSEQRSGCLKKPQSHYWIHIVVRKGLKSRGKSSFFPYVLTYLLTPWSRVLLDKPTSLHLVKIITAFTSARHLSLS